MILAFLKVIPWQLKAGSAVLLIAGAYHLYALRQSYKAGKADALTTVERLNEQARKNTEIELRRLDGGDRRRVSGYDRD